MKFFALLLCTQLALQADFKLGLENIPASLFKQLCQKRVGLITNQTGIDQQHRRNIEVLLKGGVNLTTLYAPEHGLTGLQAAELEIDYAVDSKTGLPIVSLYEGAEKTNERFPTVDLSKIDLLIFDMQDCGMRHYTYISVMYHMMGIAAKQNKQMIVLDRPNPLGMIMEGPIVEQDLLHFVAIAPLPIRHSLTIGEIARYFNKCCLKEPVDLAVIPLQYYQRDQGFNGNFLTLLSPNIANLDSCFSYCFGCVLDNMRPFDVALDTDEAFQWILLPERIVKEKQIDISELAQICTNHNITVLKQDRKESTPHTPEPVVGIKFKIHDINAVSCSNFIWDLVTWIQKYDIDFTYRFLIDHIIGTKQFTKMIEKQIPQKDLATKVNADLEQFNTLVADYLLYEPVPKVVPLRI